MSELRKAMQDDGGNSISNSARCQTVVNNPTPPTVNRFTPAATPATLASGTDLMPACQARYVI